MPRDRTPLSNGKKRQENAKEQVASRPLLDEVGTERMEKGVYEDNRSQSTKESEDQSGHTTGAGTRTNPAGVKKDSGPDRFFGGVTESLALRDSVRRTVRRQRHI